MLEPSLNWSCKAEMPAAYWAGHSLRLNSGSLNPLFSPHHHTTPCLPISPPPRDLPPAAMAFSARRSLATSLSHHFSGRLYPSISHLVPSHHEHSDPAPSPSPVPQPRPQSWQQPAPPFPSALPRPSRSRALAPFPLPFALHLAAHRYSSAPAPDSEVLADSAAAAPVSELLSDGVASAAASVSTPPLPYPGEVAAAAAESFPPVAALQHLLDAVQSFTGLNWYGMVCLRAFARFLFRFRFLCDVNSCIPAPVINRWATIALTTLMIRLATVPLLINQMKSMMKLNVMRLLYHLLLLPNPLSLSVFVTGPGITA